MVFRTDNIKRKFKYKSKVSNPSSQQPNRVSNVSSNKIVRPDKVNQSVTQNRINSLASSSLSIGGGGGGDSIPYLPDSIINKKETPGLLGSITSGFNTWKDDTFMSYADKNELNAAAAVKEEQTLNSGTYNESSTPVGLKEKASGTDFKSGTDLQARQDAHAPYLGSVTSQPRPYKKGMEALGESSNISMGWNLESKRTGSTNAASIPDIVQQQKNTKIHTGMVDQWQSDFLTNASRDSGAASNWLTDQTVKIDSMKGSDKNKTMFKNDLNKRYDNLFRLDSAPFRPNTKNPQTGQGLTKVQKKEETRKAKKDAAYNASFIYGPETNYKMNTEGKPPQGPQPGSYQNPSMDSYNNLGYMGNLEYVFGNKSKDKKPTGYESF